MCGFCNPHPALTSARRGFVINVSHLCSGPPGVCGITKLKWENLLMQGQSSFTLSAKVRKEKTICIQADYQQLITSEFCRCNLWQVSLTNTILSPNNIHSLDLRCSCEYCPDPIYRCSEYYKHTSLNAICCFPSKIIVFYSCTCSQVRR